VERSSIPSSCNNQGDKQSPLERQSSPRSWPFLLTAPPGWMRAKACIAVTGIALPGDTEERAWLGLLGKRLDLAQRRESMRASPLRTTLGLLINCANRGLDVIGGDGVRTYAVCMTTRIELRARLRRWTTIG